jgi:predicted 3-demethylubiquinone-9 3-methyltransferase (glyoxalase superfamily)
MAKNTICLWYDKDAEAAARFYAETFPDSAVGAVHRAPRDYPAGKEGDVLTVEFTVAGVYCTTNRSGWFATLRAGGSSGARARYALMATAVTAAEVRPI